MSQPKSRRVGFVLAANSGEIGPLCSTVRYEMHFFASICVRPVFGSRVIALVGQASTQRVHVPQERPRGFVGVGDKSRSVIISESSTHEPNSFVIKHVFFPMKPRPACSARDRSRRGPVST